MLISNAMLAFLGHIFIGFYFIFFALWNTYHWIPITKVLIARNLPAPFFLLSLAIGWQFIGGLMLVSGLGVTIAAFSLIFFTLFIVFLLHPFWKFNGDLRKQHMALFITNLSVTPGGLFLLIALHTPG